MRHICCSGVAQKKFLLHLVVQITFATQGRGIFYFELSKRYRASCVEENTSFFFPRSRASCSFEVMAAVSCGTADMTW